jgi:arylsulfatase
MATCIEVSGARYPKIFNGNQIIPLEGLSLTPVFENKSLKREALYWEHEGNRAVRMGKWKLVSKAIKNNWAAWDKVDNLETDQWELFDMEKDRTELNNLSEEYPEKVKKMALMWDSWAKKTGALPRPD